MHVAPRAHQLVNMVRTRPIARSMSGPFRGRRFARPTSRARRVRKGAPLRQLLDAHPTSIPAPIINQNDFGVELVRVKYLLQPIDKLFQASLAVVYGDDD